MSSISQAQTDYYVSTLGNDAADGLSVETAWATIQKATNTVQPGSTVNILEGTYNELVYINGSGVDTLPIIYQNFENGEVILSGLGQGADFANILSIVNHSHLVFDGLIIENLISSFANGILVLSDPGFEGMQNITFRNMTIRDIGYTSDSGAIPGPSDNAHGIEIYGQGVTEEEAIRNIVIQDSEVYDCILGYSEAITVNGNVDGFFIVDNQVYNNTNIAIDIAGNFGASSNPALDHARNGFVGKNICYSNISQVASSSGIYCDGCWSTVIERNVSHHNGAGITVGCEQPGSSDSVVVRNNFVYQNSLTGISVGGYSAGSGVVNDASIYNNTCFQNDNVNSSGQMRISKVEDCHIFNNILMSIGDLAYYVENISPQSYSSDYNLFANLSGGTETPRVNYQWNTMDLMDYQVLTSQEDSSLVDEVMFANDDPSTPDLHLLPESPAIDAGDPDFIPQDFDVDFDGDLRANGPVDIGADEFYVAPIVPICQDVSVSLLPSGLAFIEASEVDNGSESLFGISTMFLSESFFNCADIGVNEVELTLLDSLGNSASCLADVLVVDDSPPAITCPGDQAVEVDEMTGTYEIPDFAMEVMVVASDNCSAGLVVSQTPVAGSTLDIGTTAVTVTAEDASGNINSCSFDITVNPALGISEWMEEALDIRLYPNPASQFIQLSGQLAIDSFGIHSIDGRKVQEGVMLGERQIDISALPLACYQLRLEHDGEWLGLRFCKAGD